MSHLEREVKVPVASAAEARRTILATGGREVRPRHLEENSVFDLPSGMLRERSALLRVRRTSDRPALLTFKEKVETAERAKIRKEIETEAADGEALVAILEGLGYRPVYRYQKFRTVFLLEGANVELDETPIGCFLEIEGGPEAIEAAAGRLGLEHSTFLVEDYRSLHLAWLRERGLPEGDMVFEGEVRP